MKIEVNQAEFKEALKMVLPFAQEDKFLPIRKNVLLDANSHLTIGAANNAMSIKTSIEARIKEVGKTTVHSGLLTDYVSTLNDEIVMLALLKRLKVSQGQAYSNLATLNPDDFPILPVKPSESGIKINDFKGLINQVVFSASQDETRPVFTGVNMIIENGTLTLATADGHKGAYLQTDIDYDGTGVNTIIPTSTLTAVAKITENVEMWLQDNRVIFASNETVISGNAIQGQFPKFDTFLNMLDSIDTVVKCETDKLLDKMKSSLLFAKEKSNKGLIEIEQGQLRISTLDSDIGQMEDVLEASIEGRTDWSIIVNVQNLIDTLKVITTDIVHLYLQDKGIIIRDSNDKLFTINMPFREV